MKKFLKSISVLILVLSSSFASAQDGSISGIVIDNEFSEPLAFTNIQVKGTDTSVSTDFEGLYNIDLVAGRYTLVFSFAGYDSIEIKEVQVKPGVNTELDITLNAHILKTEAISSSVARNNE